MSPTNFECYLDRERGYPVAVASGEFDTHAVRLFEDVLEDADGEQVLIIDLRGITFMDSSGINALLRARGRALAASARLILIDMPDRPRRVLDVEHLTERFEWAADPALVELS